MTGATTLRCVVLLSYIRNLTIWYEKCRTAHTHNAPHMNHEPWTIDQNTQYSSIFFCRFFFRFYVSRMFCLSWRLANWMFFVGFINSYWRESYLLRYLYDDCIINNFQNIQSSFFTLYIDMKAICFRLSQWKKKRINWYSTRFFSFRLFLRVAQILHIAHIHIYSNLCVSSMYKTINIKW